MMAECPNLDIEDIRNMAMEDSEKFGNKHFAKVLHDEIPNLKLRDSTSFLRACRTDEIWDYNMLPDEFEIEYYFRCVGRLMLNHPDNDERSIPMWNWETTSPSSRNTATAS